MHNRDIVRTFTQTAESFNAAAVTRLPETLGMLLELAQPTSAQRWLDAACGPGIVSRALAPLVGDVVGVDRTPQWSISRAARLPPVSTTCASRSAT